MKKLSILLFAVITVLFSNSCVKEETETSNFTGYYNSKSVYNNDLLLRTVSSAGTSSFFGTGSGTDLNINANLYVSKSTGLKTVTRINKTLDSIHVYELDKPELGGLLYIIKDNILSVHQFEFVGPKNKIKTTYFYTTLTIPAGRYNSSNTNDDGAETLIDKAIERFYKWTQTLGSSEVLESIKESVSKAKNNAIRNCENAKQSIKELSNYNNKVADKNPEPIKVPLEEDPINQDEQKVIDDTVEEPFDCNTTTLAMTISDPKITNGIASVTANGIGGVGRYNYKWSDGQVGDYAVFSKSGTYTVTVTDGNGCSISSSIVIKISYCLNEQDILGNWTLTTYNTCYPNPDGTPAQSAESPTLTLFEGGRSVLLYNDGSKSEGTYTYNTDCTFTYSYYGCSEIGYLPSSPYYGKLSSCGCVDIKLIKQ